jgi:hypothetical protein
MVGRAVTIGDLRREGKRLWIYCLDCYREVETPACDLPFDDAQPVPTAGQRMKCSQCGGRRIDTRPQLYERSVAERLAAAKSDRPA